MAQYRNPLVDGLKTVWYNLTHNRKFNRGAAWGMMIIGALAGPLAQAAQMAMARGARLDHADGIEAALSHLRRDGRVDVVVSAIGAPAEITLVELSRA